MIGTSITAFVSDEEKNKIIEEINAENVFEKVVEKRIINGFIYSGKWLPCDSIELYEKAIKKLALNPFYLSYF